MDSFEKLTSFLDKLNSRKIHFGLEYNRAGYIMVCIAVPGERWEVEFDSTGNVEVEVFKGGGQDPGLEGEGAIQRFHGVWRLRILKDSIKSAPFDRSGAYTDPPYVKLESVSCLTDI
jgi:hypothetical protein